MKLAFEIVPKLDSIKKDIIEELSYHTTKLYNIVNYDLTTKEYKSYYKTNNEYKTNYHSLFLHSIHINLV